MKRIASSPMETEKKKENRRTMSSSSTASSYATITSGASSPSRDTTMTSTRQDPRRVIPPEGAPVQDEGHTTTTDGALRNHFTVDILRMNGEDFKGRMNPVVAMKQIFVQALGFAPIELAGIVPGFKGNPTLLFKTKAPFNIDEKF